MTTITALARLAPIALVALPLQPGTAQPGGQPMAPAQPFEYAVKFVCGTSTTTLAAAMVVPGNYLTVVNVHNPGPPLDFTHKVSLPALGAAGSMTPYQPYITLRYDHSADFNCRWIRSRLGSAGIPTGPFFTGFLVIQSPRELDVVAVYSAGTLAGQAASVHTERVPVRRVQ